MFGRKKQDTQPRRIDNPLMCAIRSKDPNGPMTTHIDVSQIANRAEAGIILADFAGHLAKAQAFGGKAESEAKAMFDIRSLFDAELDSPTTAVVGGIVEKSRGTNNGA